MNYPAYFRQKKQEAAGQASLDNMEDPAYANQGEVIDDDQEE
jgi:hypothetical protein